MILAALVFVSGNQTRTELTRWVPIAFGMLLVNIYPDIGGRSLRDAMGIEIRRWSSALLLHPG